MSVHPVTFRTCGDVAPGSVAPQAAPHTGPSHIAADRDAYAAGCDLNVHPGVGTRRLLIATACTVGVIVLVTTGALLLVAHNARGAGSTKTPTLPTYAHSAVRTPRAWAAQVNAVCRQMNPKLVADLHRIESFPQSDYGSCGPLRSRRR